MLHCGYVRKNCIPWSRNESFLEGFGDCVESCGEDGINTVVVSSIHFCFVCKTERNNMPARGRTYRRRYRRYRRRPIGMRRRRRIGTRSSRKNFWQRTRQIPNRRMMARRIMTIDRTPNFDGDCKVLTVRTTTDGLVLRGLGAYWGMFVFSGFLPGLQLSPSFNDSISGFKKLVTLKVHTKVTCVNNIQTGATDRTVVLFQGQANYGPNPPDDPLLVTDFNNARTPYEQPKSVYKNIGATGQSITRCNLAISGTYKSSFGYTPDIDKRAQDIAVDIAGTVTNVGLPTDRFYHFFIQGNANTPADIVTPETQGISFKAVSTYTIMCYQRRFETF